MIPHSLLMVHCDKNVIAVVSRQGGSHVLLVDQKLVIGFRHGIRSERFGFNPRQRASLIKLLQGKPEILLDWSWTFHVMISHSNHTFCQMFGEKEFM